jgi:hypothetical protein
LHAIISRYRTQLCKDGLDCDRPVCFFAHTIQELRTPSLPTSLANSPDGTAFAAFFGGPTYASLLQQVPRPPACLPQQQQHMMPGFSLSTAAAVLHQQQQQLQLGQQQLQLGQQLQIGVLQQQPSSPQSSESSLGGAALVPSESFPGSDEDWAALCAAQKHLRRWVACLEPPVAGENGVHLLTYSQFRCQFSSLLLVKLRACVFEMFDGGAGLQRLWRLPPRFRRLLHSSSRARPCHSHQRSQSSWRGC